MTLNRKTLQALAAASAVSILLSYAVLRGVIYTTFVDLENEARVSGKISVL